ncbi:MAG: DUF2071 domain-containing protein [Planctomycetes bacterium]|jgi:hypothetical protein|nr:DUF2071 domain-containing protein [Planctomycetota bacterium]
MHPALVDVSHLPVPPPARPWSITMRWEELLFLHWRTAAEPLQRHLPNGLTLDTFDGSAWLGVVPFRMAATRFRLLPRVPGSHTFAELNLRTYVRHGERRGVWFFSLDAASRLAVEGARWSFGLPYFMSRMACARRGDVVHYEHTRTDRRGPAATFTADWRAVGSAQLSAPGTLEHFLTERYCLFARRRGRLLRGDIAHRPWRLAPAEVSLAHCDMTRLLELRLEGAPASALVAQPVEVAAWSPVPA